MTINRVHRNSAAASNRNAPFVASRLRRTASAKSHAKKEALLCCPECAIQYIDSARVPDFREQELRAYENNFHFFIREDKSWS
jgi:hypothetical protein